MEDVPVSPSVIINNSASMHLNGSVVKAATLLLVPQSNSQNEVFVVNGNDGTFRDVFFNDDIQKMEEGLALARVRHYLLGRS